MAVVNIPAPLRPIAGGKAKVDGEGATLRDLIDGLEALYPGLKARLAEGDRVRPGMAVFIDGTQVSPQLSTRVPDHAEIFFAPAVAGG